MTAVIGVNVLLAIPFLLAFIAVPLWMTFKRPQTPSDHSYARAFLRAKGALAQAAPITPAPVPVPQRPVDPPRRPADDRVRAAA